MTYVTCTYNDSLCSYLLISRKRMRRPSVLEFPSPVGLNAWKTLEDIVIISRKERTAKYTHQLLMVGQVIACSGRSHVSATCQRGQNGSTTDLHAMVTWRVSHQQAGSPKARDTRAEPDRSSSCTASIICKHTRMKRTTACWPLRAKKPRISNAISGPSRAYSPPAHRPPVTA